MLFYNINHNIKIIIKLFIFYRYNHKKYLKIIKNKK